MYTVKRRCRDSILAAVPCVLLINGFVAQGYAAEPRALPVEEHAESKQELPLAATYANWIFSGSVSNEKGDTYEYFFQAKRKQNYVHAMLSLVDAQTKTVIFMQNAEVQLTDPQTDNWVIGDIFLRYNTINRSWIFGIKKANQMGFNFKVDTINQLEHAPKIQKVREGVTMSVVQTGQVNGHIQLQENTPAQFVTGKNAWFREIVMQKSSTKVPVMQGLLCRFDDGSGLYSMRMGDKPFWHSTFSGSYDPEGVAAAVSKSIHVEQLKAGLWRVKVPYPKLQFDLSDVLQDQALVLGFVDKKQKSGFCVISKEDGLA
jgi:hypothetical protein